MKIDVIKAKHLEATRKYRENNRERVRAIALDYARRKKAVDPEAYLKTMRERAKKYRLKDPEKYRKRWRAWKRLQSKDEINRWQREYRQKHPEKVKMYNLTRKPKQQLYARIKWLTKYSLTLETYGQMLLQQGGKCAICTNTFGDQKPNVDHCHTTGKVRGLLCSPCNIVLGYVEKTEKTPNFYLRFVEYLKH